MQVVIEHKVVYGKHMVLMKEFNNDTCKVIIGARPTNNDGEDRSLEIFNYITMSKNGSNARTMYLIIIIFLDIEIEI